MKRINVSREFGWRRRREPSWLDLLLVVLLAAATLIGCGILAQ